MAAMRESTNAGIIADSGGGYTNELECLDVIKRVKGSANALVKRIGNLG
jgi:hypothetical protein